MAKEKNWLKHARYLNLALSLGISMILPIFLGIYGGEWLDRRRGSSPLFLLLGLFLGLGIGFYNLWGELSRLAEIDKRRKLEEEKQNEENIETCQFKAGKKDK